MILLFAMCLLLLTDYIHTDFIHSNGTKGIESFEISDYIADPYFLIPEWKKVEMRHRRISYLGGTSYDISIYVPGTENHPRLDCTFETTTLPKYHFHCGGEDYPAHGKTNVNECHENGDYTFK